VVAAALTKQGFTVKVEGGAGAEAKFRDDDYKAAGAKIVDRQTAYNSGKYYFD
jgi:NAD(P) transhydrogenase